MTDQEHLSGYEDPGRAFQRERTERIESYASNTVLQARSEAWLESAFLAKYMYNFDWLGRPIIQLPADIVAVQEILWTVKPDVVVEIGVAHGGSLLLTSSVMALLDLCDARMKVGRQAARRVLGIDIDIRPHNRRLIEAHPLADSITMFEGSSIDEQTVEFAHEFCGRDESVVVFLDSCHTRDHVFAELSAYSPLVTKGSYCVVFDTIVERLPSSVFLDRDWEPGNSPQNAVDDFLRVSAEQSTFDRFGGIATFTRDTDFDAKLLVGANRGGYLRRV